VKHLFLFNFQVVNNDHIHVVEQRLRLAINEGLDKEAHAKASVKCYPVSFLIFCFSVSKSNFCSSKRQFQYQCRVPSMLNSTNIERVWHSSKDEKRWKKLKAMVLQVCSWFFQSKLSYLMRAQIFFSQFLLNKNKTFYFLAWSDVRSLLADWKGDWSISCFGPRWNQL